MASLLTRTRFEVPTRQPIAETSEQILTVLGRGPRVASHADGVLAHLTGYDSRFERQVVQDRAIEVGDDVGAQATEAARLVGPDLIHRADDVVDLAREILRRGWQLQPALEVREHFLFGEGVAFDRRGGEHAFGQEDLIEVLVLGRLQRHSRDVLTLRLGFAEKQPKLRRGWTEIDPKGDPRMRPLVCPQ